MSTPPPRETERTTEDGERKRIGKIIEDGAQQVFEAIPFGDEMLIHALDNFIQELTNERRLAKGRIHEVKKPPSLRPRPYTEGDDLASAPPTSHPGEEIRFPLPARIPSDLKPPITAPRDFIPTDALPTARRAIAPSASGQPEAFASTDPPGSSP